MTLRSMTPTLRAMTKFGREAFAVGGLKGGETIRLRLPAQYTVTDGAVATFQDSIDTSVSLTVAQKNVAMDFSTLETTLKIDEYRDRYIVPAMAAIANKMELDALTFLYQNSLNFVGTPGTTPASAQVYLDAQARLTDAGAPIGDMKRAVILTPSAMARSVDAFKGLFAPVGDISSQNRTGVMQNAWGGMYHISQAVPTHTVGPLGGTPRMNGSTSEGATTLVTDGWTASAANRLKKGDKFTIANVNAAGLAGQDLGYARVFTAAADADSDGAGNLTVTIAGFPRGIRSTGAYKNVTAMPANDALITILSGTASTSYPQNIAFHQSGFVGAMFAPEKPTGLPNDKSSVVTDEESGVALRIAQFYDGTNDRDQVRVDVLYGFGAWRPQLGCVITG